MSASSLAHRIRACVYVYARARAAFRIHVEREYHAAAAADLGVFFTTSRERRERRIKRNYRPLENGAAFYEILPLLVRTSFLSWARVRIFCVVPRETIREVYGRARESERDFNDSRVGEDLDGSQCT